MAEFYYGGYTPERSATVWRLAVEPSDSVRRQTLEDIVEYRSGLNMLNVDEPYFLAALGLRISSFNAMKSVSLHGLCRSKDTGACFDFFLISSPGKKDTAPRLLKKIKDPKTSLEDAFQLASSLSHLLTALEAADGRTPEAQAQADSALQEIVDRIHVDFRAPPDSESLRQIIDSLLPLTSVDRINRDSTQFVDQASRRAWRVWLDRIHSSNHPTAESRRPGHRQTAPG